MNHCPWSSFTRGSTHFCEAPLCAWIESPGIAWAGLIYIFVGLYLLKKRNPNSHWILNLFPYFAIVMGIGSALYHASHTFMFQVIDVGGMFLLGNALVFSNIFLLKKIKNQKLIFWVSFIVQILIFTLLKGKSGPIILGIQVLLFLITEFMIPSRNRSYLWMSLALFILAGGALWIEHKSGACNPDNHFFQWHAVWDGLCAFTYITLHKYLSQKRTI